MHKQPTFREHLAPWAVRLPALWVLCVTWIKMEQGSPNDIPAIIRNSLLGPELSYFGTISIELAFALATLLRPQLGWILMSALMSVFVAVLLHLIWIGATSCGCFGGAISLSPYAMLAIDGSLCALMLATKPWSSVRTGRVPWFAVALAGAAGAATPWLRVENEPVAVPPPVFHLPSETNGDVPLAAATAGADRESAPAPIEGSTWKLPEKLPRWVEFTPSDWVGKSIHETELAVWMNTRAFSEDASWILYLETCTHCRDYMQALESEFANDPKIYVHVRLSTKDDDSAGVVAIKPPGEQAVLPAEVQWVVSPKPPPWTLVLEGGMVKSATNHGE